MFFVSAQTLRPQDTLQSVRTDSLKTADTVKSEVPVVVPADSARKTSTPPSEKRDSSVSRVNKTETKSDLDKVLDFAVIKKINVFTLIEALVFLLAGFVVSRIFDSAGRSLMKKGIKPVVRGGVISAKLILWIIIFYLLVSLFVTNADELFLFLFVAVLVITGVAAMPAFRNFTGGIYLSLSKPFDKGDYISVAGYKGEVQKTGWRTTVIRTEEGSIISLPNSMLMNNPVENINVGQKEQLVTLDFEFPAGYGESVITRIIKDAALASPYLYINREVNVFLDKADFVRNTNKYKVNLYIYDAKFENELTDSINTAILGALKKLDVKN